VRVGGHGVLPLPAPCGEAGALPLGGQVEVGLVNHRVQGPGQGCQHGLGQPVEGRAVPGVDADEHPPVGAARRVAAADHEVVLQRKPVTRRDARNQHSVAEFHRVHTLVPFGIAVVEGAPGDTYVSGRSVTTR
jgi:hypothetical protein